MTTGSHLVGTETRLATEQIAAADLGVRMVSMAQNVAVVAGDLAIDTGTKCATGWAARERPRLSGYRDSRIFPGYRWWSTEIVKDVIATQVSLERLITATIVPVDDEREGPWITRTTNTSSSTTPPTGCCSSPSTVLMY
jgi:hypothetical protein